MKILIIGSKGNLGLQLQKVFQDEDLTSWDKEDIDISNKKTLFAKVIALNPQVIINSAAYNAVDKCEENKKEFILAKKINGNAPGYLAEVSLEIGALFVHYSSDYVFDGKKRTGYKETDQTKAINNYGKSKLLGEKKIIEQAAKGLKFYIIRTSKLFGPQGESLVAKPSFFDIMLDLGNKKAEIDVVDAEKSCFTYTVDLAQATKNLINAKKISGVYHIINEGACTWYEATRELFEINNINIKINPVSQDKFSRSAKRPKYSVLQNTKLNKLRHYTEALREYCKK